MNSNNNNNNTVYLRKGNTITPFDRSNLNVQESIPPGGVYIVCFDSLKGQFFLEELSSWTMPKKLYGDAELKADRILRSFSERNSSTGVLLTGEKGSGKTLLSKVIALKSTLPTLVVTTAYTGDLFKKFIHDIEQECIILFDEFEKVYAPDEQNELLTLLDGLFSSKKLFIFTANEKYKIQTPFFNRPGRLYYFVEYAGLSKDFIQEYCEDNLKDSLKLHIKAVISCTLGFGGKFNFDMLQALVEEMNRFDESPSFAVKWLNIRPGFMSEFSAKEWQATISLNPKCQELFSLLSEWVIFSDSAINKHLFECDRKMEDPIAYLQQGKNIRLSSDVYLVKPGTSMTDLKVFLEKENGIEVFSSGDESCDEAEEEDSVPVKKGKASKKQQKSAAFKKLKFVDIHLSSYQSNVYNENALLSSVRGLLDKVDVVQIRYIEPNQERLVDIDSETSEYIFDYAPFIVRLSEKKNEFVYSNSWMQNFAF